MSDIRLETPRRVRLLVVVEVEATRGTGSEGDPVRIVTQYWHPEDGIVLAERDRWADEHPMARRE